ncbi:MAG: enoyl-CoA hydratase/isomerase family protein [Acidobacteriota bacterium]
MADAAAVLVTREGPVATVTFNRPGTLNALGPELSRALAESLETLAAEPGIRVVVLTGAGRAFCAGGDMAAAWRALEAGDPRSLFDGVLEWLHRAVLTVRHMPQPVVAAINGPTSGAGLSLAAACDLRLAASSAVFKIGYTSIGLCPDAGWTVTVPRLVGLGPASELVLLDHPVDAERALTLGLVNEVCPADSLLTRTAEVAAGLVRQPAASLAAAKALLNAALFPELEAQLARERRAVVELSAGPDFRQRLAVFLKR